jgi:uncharacterized membrane protein YraQ (UPF0718 family)
MGARTRGIGVSRVLATTLPTWLSYSNLAWIVTGGVIAVIVIALMTIALVRSVAARAVVFAVAVALVAGGVWYRSSMSDSRRTCSTTLFDAQVRTPGCPVH